MKTFFTILFSLLFYLNCISQSNKNSKDWEWAPINAVWMYKTANMNKNDKDVYARYWYVRSDKDTVINEINCRKLDVTWHYYPDFEPVSEPPRFTYQNGGKIYFFNEEINDFVLSFDYNLSENDTVEWQMPIFNDCINSFYLDSIFEWQAGVLSGEGMPFIPFSIFMHSNKPISTYKYGYVSNNCYAGAIGLYETFLAQHGYGRIFQYMGVYTDIFELSILEELQNSCMCYYDGEVKINPASFDFINNDTLIHYQDSCTKYYELLYNEIQGNIIKPNISIYPNPFTKNVQISSQNINIKNMEILDLSGNIVLKKNWLGKENDIDLGILNSGIYFIRFFGDKEILTKKMIKL